MTGEYIKNIMLPQVEKYIIENSLVKAYDERYYPTKNQKNNQSENIITNILPKKNNNNYSSSNIKIMTPFISPLIMQFISSGKYGENKKMNKIFYHLYTHRCNNTQYDIMPKPVKIENFKIETFIKNLFTIYSVDNVFNIITFLSSIKDQEDKIRYFCQFTGMFVFTSYCFKDDSLLQKKILHKISTIVNNFINENTYKNSQDEYEDIYCQYINIYTKITNILEYFTVYLNGTHKNPVIVKNFINISLCMFQNIVIKHKSNLKYLKNFTNILYHHDNTSSKNTTNFEKTKSIIDKIIEYYYTINGTNEELENKYNSIKDNFLNKISKNNELNNSNIISTILESHDQSIKEKKNDNTTLSIKENN